MNKVETKIDMVNGRMIGKIIRFSIPLILSGILQLLFNAADVIVVGQFAGNESLAAVSANGALINLIVNVFIGFSVGANVVMARAIGSKNINKAERVVHTSILLSLVSGVLVAILGLFIARPILVAMKVNSDVIAKSTTYVRIYLLGAPVGLLYNFGASILRANGDTKRPLYFLIISGFINVGLNLLFVIVFRLDVAGVALATTLAQIFSAGAVTVCLIKEKGYCHLSLRRLRFTSELKEIALVGVPAGLNSAFFSLSNVVLQSAVNSFNNTVIMAGSSTAGNIEGFVYTSMNAIYNASITFTGQNYGAKKYHRIKFVLLDCIAVVTVVGMIMSGIFYIFAEFFASLYSPQEDVIAYAIERMHTIMPIYFLCGIMEVVVGVLRGMGYSIVPMLTSFAGVCALRIVWVYTVFEKFKTLSVLYLSYPVSWGITLLMNFAIWLVLYLRLLRKNNDNKNANFVSS